MAHSEERWCIVFDLLKLRDFDLRSEPLLKRKKNLERILKGCSPRLLYVDHMERQGLAMLALAGARLAKILNDELK